MRSEVRALDQHIFSLIGDLRIFAAHDSGKSDGFLRVCDDEHLVRERTLDAVESLELLTGIRTTHDNPSAAEFLKVESVQRLAQLVKDVVGDVGDVVDRTLADRFESLHQPIRRWTNLHAA